MAANSTAAPATTSKKSLDEVDFAVLTKREKDRLAELQQYELMQTKKGDAYLPENLKFKNLPSSYMPGAVAVIYAGGTFGCTHGGCSLLEVGDSKKSLRPAKGSDLFEYLQRFHFLKTGSIVEGSPQIIEEKNYNPGFTDVQKRSLLVYVSLEAIDSTEATIGDWSMLIRAIYFRRHLYGGFVIIHGTDTLAYTAAALVMAFDCATIPIVITGSQTPLVYGHSDALNNLFGACEAAGWMPRGRDHKSLFNVIDGVSYPVLDVMVFFDTKLMAASRVLKMHSTDWNAFQSPNCGALAYFNGSWHLNFEQNDAVLKRVARVCNVPFVPGQEDELIASLQKFEKSVHTEVQLNRIRVLTTTSTVVNLPKFDARVVVVKVFPGCCGAIFRMSDEEEMALIFYSSQAIAVEEEIASTTDPNDLEKLRAFRESLCNGKVFSENHSKRPKGVTREDFPFVESYKSAIAKAFAWTDRISGVVVEAYGAGNVPSSIQMILRIINPKVPVAFVTECRAGMTAAHYDTAMKVGVSLGDCTLVTAYTKMVFLASAASFADMTEDRRVQFIEASLKVAHRNELSDESRSATSMRVARYV